MIGEANDCDHDSQMAAQFERIIRRVKLSMNYRGSYSTRDILGSLVARWIRSGEWQRLRALPQQGFCDGLCQQKGRLWAALRGCAQHRPTVQ